MSRNRASAKAAGAKTERVAADYLAEYVDDRIDRRVKTGALDKGDIGGVRFPMLGEQCQACREGVPSYIATCTCSPLQNGRVVVEVKDCATIAIGPWLNEAETERINDGADVGLVIYKARGKGAPGDLRVVMTLRDLATLLSGRRPAS